MVLKLFFFIFAVRPHGFFFFWDTVYSALPSPLLEKGKLYPKRGRAIDPWASASEESEISFRINITNSISRRVPMDHDSHRRWHPREMYGWHQHMHERRAAAVSVGYYRLPFDSHAAVTASWWCDRSKGWERRARERRK